MLNIRIFEVDHGFCAAIQNGDYQILIDCGYHSRSGFFPVRYLFSNSIRHLNYLIMPTFTEGSLAGFYDLIGHSFSNCFTIDHLLVNPSIDRDSLPELVVRNFQTINSLKFLNDACQRCSSVERTVQLGDIELSFFWNTYPEFLDFSNLSLVTFLSSRGINMLFPGNLRAEGWRTLLRNSKFREQLRQVNVLVASNHGQVNGYCSEIFDYCNPHLIILSNHDCHQASPSAVRQYEQQLQRVQKSKQPRLLTTRNAGMITIQQASSNNPAQVITERSRVYQLQPAEVYQVEARISGNAQRKLFHLE
ncbi:hypothetical protein CEN44_04000 [Fischerella muscicola CCMEE 5323]|uniref:MBL fold metallo-hydrolase n=1 Tax=Fischerella muscicola CCMEE 5323 TaxID=2019572 RepID=A0A2N6K7G5_FISMU|nr:hypothetical protein CEN44_04000 [Fischerella muscicola CCMEE 5323]